MRKGIILAGGLGTRLRPLTDIISKQILPVYDKPMIFYALSVLMIGDIREVLIISSPHHLPMFEALLGDGSQYGISISYAAQEEPRGLPDTFIVGESFIGTSPTALILGDNLFYGRGLSNVLANANQRDAGATIFTVDMLNPTGFGVLLKDANGKPSEIIEKPEIAVSNQVVTGLYYYDARVSQLTKELQPSSRGELEITDLNNRYLQMGDLESVDLGRGFTWMDLGTTDSLLEASNMVSTLERRQGLKIACLEEVAWRKGWINLEQIAERARDFEPGPYASYLHSLIQKETVW
jgi:glucose-1-phosphate thymidylyltransferase